MRSSVHPIAAGNGTTAVTAVPILLFHSVSSDPPSWIAPYAVTPDFFAAVVDLVASSGRRPMTVAGFADALVEDAAIAREAVVVTFDDGFADTAVNAAPTLAARGIPATVYVTTGALGAGPSSTPIRLGPAPMLTCRQISQLDEAGIEIGSHGETHISLDAVPRRIALREITASRDRLEDILSHAIRSFAYPHGHHSRSVCAMVARAGYSSAAAVRNALSSPRDDRWALARLTLRCDTPISTVIEWLNGSGARVAPFPEGLGTRTWRIQRRLVGSHMQ